MAKSRKSGHTLESIGEMVRNLSDRLHITSPKPAPRKKSASAGRMSASRSAAARDANGAATTKQSRKPAAAKKRSSAPRKTARSKAR